MKLHRRHFLRRCSATAAAFALWRAAGAQSAIGASPYGPLGAPDAHGVRVPAGFTARLLAVTGERVRGTDHRWHRAPDGGAVFARAKGGGWVYVSNSEVDDGGGGVGVLSFAADGEIAAAYRILAGTSFNCAGGPTPWGTWLSCEEIDSGRVWECNPYTPGQGVVRPALGRFKHEAAAVDPATDFVYLTEDEYDSRFYRFRPAARGDLSAGTLEAAEVAKDGRVGWRPVSATEPARDPRTRLFLRGEGAWFAHGTVYFSTTADHRVWAYDTRRETLAVHYEAAQSRGALRWPDNLTVHAPSRQLFVAEDGDDMQIVLLAAAGAAPVVAPFVQLVGHGESELTGLAFSPDGTRLYFSSQRGRDGETGMSFEVRGPFLRSVA
ncbi:MAG TPA: DUF839 domain-containing protein [Gammaproteobacteria bacterium]|nr:DUF839 domain-containing protein [Gammaproteobacteria bacterium]